MSIRWKLTLIFLAIALVPTLFVELMVFEKYKQSIEAAETEHLQDVLAFKANKLETYFENRREDIKLTQNRYIVKQNIETLTQHTNSNDREYVNAMRIIDWQFKEIQSVISDIADIMILNTKGEVVYAIRPQHKHFNAYKHNEVQKKAIEEGKKRVYFSQIYFDNVHDKRYEMLITGPLTDLNDELAGVIVFEIDMKGIYEIIEEKTALGMTGETFIAKREGNEAIILSPLKYEPNAPLNIRIKLGSKTAIPVQKGVQGETGAGIYPDYRGKQVIAAWSYLPYENWGMIAKIDTKEAFASVWNMEKLSIVIAIAIMLMAGFAAFNIAEQISKPIEKLKEGAMIIGRGNLDYKTGMSRKDEIGQLSKSFDEMTQNLKLTTATKDELNKEIEERKRYEETLRESEEKFRMLAENARAIIGVVQGDRFVYVNPYLEEISGYSRDELMQMSIIELTHPDYREVIMSRARRRQAGETIESHYEFGMLTKSKEKKLLDFSVTRIFLHGQPALVGIAIDITYRKQLETSLAESERHFRTIFEQAPLGTALHDSKTGRFLSVNQKYCEFAGRSQEELLKIDFQTITYPDDLQADLDNMKLLHEGKIPYYSMEKRYVRPDGTIIWGILTVVPMSKENEIVRTHIAMVVDITERKCMEETLRQSRAKYRDLVQNANSAILRWDHEGILTFFNEYSEKLFGYTSQEVLGKDVNIIVPKRESTGRDLSGLIKDIAANTEKYAYNVNENICKDGRRVWMAWTNRAIYDENGNIKEIMSVATDITETKKYEQELAKINRILRALKNSVSAVIEAKDEMGLLQEITEILNRDCGYGMTAILYAEEDEAKTLRPIVCPGVDEAILKTLKLSWGDNERGQGAAAHAVRSRKAQTFKNIDVDSRFAQWGNLFGEQGYKSVAAVPLIIAGVAFGAIAVFSKLEDNFREDELKLLNEIGDDLSFGISNLRIKAAREEVEKKLHQSLTHLEIATAAGAIGTWEHDFLNEELTWDDRCKMIFGVEADSKPTFEKLLNLLHPDDRPIFVKETTKSISECKGYEGEFRIIRRGEIRWIYAKGRGLGLPGQCVRMTGVVIDVTERKKREEELAKLNRILGALKSSGMAMINAEDEISFIKEICKIIAEDCGYAMAQVSFALNDKAKTIKPMAYSGFEEGFLESLKMSWGDNVYSTAPSGKAIKTGKIAECKDMMTDPDFVPWREIARERGYRSSVAIPLKENEKVFGELSIVSRKENAFSSDEIGLFSEFANDLSYGISFIRVKAGRAEAERELRESLARLELATEAGKIGIWENNLSKNVLIWDERSKKMYGIPAGTEPTFEMLLNSLYPEDRQMFEEAVKDTLSECKAFEIEYRILREGEIRWMLAKGNAYKGETGLCERLVGITIDTTERKKREQELAKLSRIQRAMSDANEAMVHADNEMSFMQEICNIVDKDCGYAMLFIAFKMNDNAKTIKIIAYSGLEKRFIEELKLSWDEQSGHSRGPTGKAVLTGKVNICKDMLTDPDFEVQRELTLKRGYRSAIAVPLIENNKVFGAMTVTEKIPDAFTQEESNLLTKLGNRLSFGLSYIRAKKAREKAEMELRESLAALELATEAGKIGIWEYDIVNDILKWDVKCKRMFNLAAETEVTLEMFFNLLHPDDREIVKERIHQCQISCGEYDSEDRILQPDGGIRWVFAKGRGISGDSGKCERMTGTVVDITERKKKEEELAKLSRILRALSNSIEAMMHAEEEKTFLREICDIIKRDCGYIMVAVFNRQYDEAKTLKPIAYSGFEEGYLEKMKFSWADNEYGHGPTGYAIRTAKPAICKDIITDPNFEPWRAEALKRGYHSIISIPLIENDIPFGALNIYSNVSNPFSEDEVNLLTELANELSFGILSLKGRVQREIYQEELKWLNVELQRSNMELEQFANVISHDLREPLRAVSGFVDLLKMRYSDKLDVRANEYIGFALWGCQNMKKMIFGLLEYSRVQTKGKSFEEVSLDDVLQSAINNLKASIDENEAIITYDKMCKVKGDDVQLTQLFQNLIHNALKFRKEEAPKIHIGCREEKEGVLFWVSDNGIGIGEDFKNRIFTIFQREDKKEREGEGVGLAVCKRIVERHNGRIWVESEEGKGSTFYFTIKG